VTITEQALRVRRYRLNTPLSSRCQACGQFSRMQPTTGAGRSNMQDRLGCTPNQCRPARREHAGRPPPLALLLVRHHGVADADRTVLRAPTVTSSRST
jgi:hypothetical protein